MSPPIDIDGSEIQKATIDGQNVSEITIDGQQTAGFVDIPDSAIDSFEDQNIAEYTQYSSGTVSNVWSFAQSPTPQDGSFILESNGSGLDPQIIRSTSGLPYYPESGDKYHYYTYIGGNDKTGTEFEFATQSDTANPDTYLIRIDPLGDLAAIRERVGGATIGLANTTFSDPAGQWYEVVLDWTAPGAATVGCYDLNGNQQWELSFSDSDTTNNLASGGIGWTNDPFNGVSVYWDDLRQVADDYTP